MKIRLFKLLFYIVYFMLYILLIVGVYLLLGCIPYFKETVTTNLNFIVRAIIASTFISMIFIPIVKIKRIQRFFYTKLYYFARSKNNRIGKSLIPLIVKLFYLNELECNNDINNLNKSTISIICGDIFSGKSYLLEKFIHENLYTKASEYRSIYLFDLSIYNCTEFANKLESCYYNEAIVILDNIDLITSREFNSLLTKIKGNTDKFKKLIIVTSYSDSVINRFTNTKELKILSVNIFEREDDIIKRYKDVVIKKSGNKKRGESAARNYLDKVINPCDNLNALIVFNSVFRLKISKLLKFYKVSYLNYIKYQRTLKYYKMLDGDKYLNQNVALNIILSKATDSFMQNFIVSIFSFIEKNKDLHLSELKLWFKELLLFAANNITVNRASFDKVILNYNLNYILKIINLVCDNKQPDDELNIHKAILLERCNKPFDAEKIYNDIIVSAQRKKDEFLENYAKIGAICCDHTRKDISEVLNTVNDADIFIKYSKRYWTLHIEMHRGNFGYKNFKKLLEDLNKNIKKLDRYSVYDVYHLLRRVYFETIRAYLLSYENNLEELSYLNDLKNKVPQFLIEYNRNEFMAFYYKFNLGRVLQFDYLSTKQFSDAYKSPEPYNVILHKYESMSQHSMQDTDKEPLNLANKIYSDSIAYFNLIGGPQDQYVLFNIYELSLCNEGDLNLFISKFEEYKNFCVDAKLYEYAYYAEFYLIKTYMCQKLSLNMDTEDCANNIQECISECGKFIALTKNSSAHINRYAICRLEMFMIIFKIMTLNTIDQEQIDTERKTIVKRCRNIIDRYPNYKREIEILQYIVNKNSEISIGRLKKIIRYYPIINQ